MRRGENHVHTAWNGSFGEGLSDRPGQAQKNDGGGGEEVGRHVECE